MVVKLDDLNSYDLDILKEIGNIGAGNAATALSDILQGRVDMSVPKVEVLKFNNLVTLLGGEENLVAGVLIAITGGIDGYIMFVLEDKFAANLVDLIMQDEVNRNTTLEFSEFDKSALKEITNIISGSYLSAISFLTNIEMKMSVPYLAIDMAGAILSVPIAAFGEVGESVLLVETEFLSGSKYFVGNFFLIPSVDSFDTLFDALRIGV